MALSPEQLRKIRQHLKDNWLKDDSFIKEIFDHYALAIEEKMAQGREFSAALHDVYKDFGRRIGLLEMERSYRHSIRQSVRAVMWQSAKSFYVVLLSLLMGAFFLFCYFQFPNLQHDPEMPETYMVVVQSSGFFIILSLWGTVLFHTKSKSVARQSCAYLTSYATIAHLVVSGLLNTETAQQYLTHLYTANTFLFFAGFTLATSFLFTVCKSWQILSVRYRLATWNWH